MGQPKENLVILLLYSLAVGAFLGLLWDFFRIIRIICYGKRKPVHTSPLPLPATEKEVGRALAFSHTQKALSPSVILIFLSDLLFCLTAAVSVILLLFHLNGGEIRGFALFGAAVGFSVYFVTVGRLTVLFSDLIIKYAKKFIFLVLSITLIPIFKLILKPIRFIQRKITDKIKRIQADKYMSKRIREASVGFRLFDK